jgi:hypothetical protein
VRSGRAPAPEERACSRGQSTSASFFRRRDQADRREIRCVGEENLTSDDVTRTADRSTPVILIKTRAAVRRDFGIALIAG